MAHAAAMEQKIDLLVRKVDSLMSRVDGLKGEVGGLKGRLAELDSKLTKGVADQPATSSPAPLVISTA